MPRAYTSSMGKITLTFRLLACSYAFFFLLTAPAAAESDVYAFLPGDASVVSYATGDLDGDGVPELVLHYRSAGTGSVAAFAARSGRWMPWWSRGQAELAPGGGRIHSVRLVDTNGDSAMELAVSSLTAGSASMVTRLLAFDAARPDGPAFRTILEDATAPPGYPLFGEEEGRPSVTFLDMGARHPDGRKENGHRRVHCWDGSAFEVCREVVWEVR